MGRTLVRLLAAIAVLGLVAAWGLRGGGEDAHACGQSGPFDFDTYEAEDYLPAYNRAIELAAAGKAITSPFTVASTGEVIDIRYQGLLRGPRGGRSPVADPSAAIPPTVMKSIAWIEASWSNAAAAVPYGGVGPVIRSFDCGYGIGQITTGMTNITGTPSGRQAAIGTHFLFNLAESARIIADKWNSAPRYRPIAGTGDPSAIEDWYFAIWSYNGFAFSNHPLNPGLDPLRGGGLGKSPIYHCYDTAAASYQESGGAVKHGYGDYTYPERVYGCMRYPPQKNGQRLWQPQAFEMPHFELQPVAKAFDARNFSECEDAGFSGGCPKMDFPTSFLAPPPPEVSPTPTASPSVTATVTVTVTPSPSATASPTPVQFVPITTHKDTTPPVDPALALTFLGAPVLDVDGPAVAQIATSGLSTAVSVRVRNLGSWVAPFRVRTSAPWLVVRHSGDPQARTIDGGVAVGHGTLVVLQNATATKPKVSQDGYVSSLIVTLAQVGMPGGTSLGTVTIEPLWGLGKTYVLEVTATNTGEGSLPMRAIVPGASSDGPLE